MTASLNNKVEQRGHLDRYGGDAILKRIYAALPDAQKELFVAYRDQWVDADRHRTDLPFPLCISLELVAACNLHCSHCVRNSPAWRERAPQIFSGKRMGMETFKRIADECAAHNLPSLWLGCSGEALLDKNLPDMIEYAHGVGIFDTIITTNGTLLTREIIDRLIAIPLTRLNISLDAFTPETYKKVRGADLHTVVDAIHYLLEQRGELPVVRLTFIDLPANRHEKADFINYWQDKVELVDIQRFIDFNDLAPAQTFTPFPCSCPWRLIDIMANGDLVPCNSFFAVPDLVMGNIHQNSIKEIWDSEKFRRLRESLKSGEYQEPCRACFAALQSEEKHND